MNRDFPVLPDKLRGGGGLERVLKTVSDQEISIKDVAHAGKHERVISEKFLLKRLPNPGQRYRGKHILRFLLQARSEALHHGTTRVLDINEINNRTQRPLFLL